LIVVVVLPTPPFWLATAITLGNGRPSAGSVAVMEEELLFTRLRRRVDGTEW
jgi:hypothetical protein